MANLVPPCHFKHDYLLPAEAYCRKAFEAYKGKHRAGASSQAEQKQTEVASEVLETGIDKNGQELIRISPQDLVDFHAKQHELGVFATKSEREQLAKAFIENFRPGAEIHSKTRTRNAPTSNVDNSTKRKRDSSQASQNSQSSKSTVGNKGGEPTRNTTPAQESDHKVQAFRKRGGSNSSTGASSRSRVAYSNTDPAYPLHWCCLNCSKYNPIHFFYCGDCKVVKSTPPPKQVPQGQRDLTEEDHAAEGITNIRQNFSVRAKLK